MPLDILSEVKKMREAYASDTRQHTFNALVLGESGTGKSFLTRTCRTPIHVDSFDPGGTKSLKLDLPGLASIDSGSIVADTRFENEDPLAPTAYGLWKSELDRRIKEGYFNYFGTYVLDSATTWSTAIMNWILKKAGIPGQAPRFTHDYTPQKVEIQNMLYKCLNLPCDFILTGHLELLKEEDGKNMKFRFMTTGKGSVTIPLLFDEQYVLVTKETSKGLEHQLITQPTGLYLARSRMAAGGKLDLYEQPNIMNILRKTGYPTECKSALV